MTGSFKAIWRIEPATPPRPYRHCATCGTTRAFVSSGRIRLNANGRRLDAWLIYKCETCERTWNLPVLERASVALVPAADLQAMQESDPDWVRVQAFDLARLRRHCERVEQPEAVTVRLMQKVARQDGPSVIALTLDVPVPTGDRLDRLLARELRLSRSELPEMVRTGGLEIDPVSERALRKPVASGVALRFVLDRLTECQRARVLAGLMGDSPEA